MVQEYKQAKNELRQAKSAVELADNLYQNQVQLECITNEVFENFKSVNPELYKQLNSWDPFNSGNIVDIHVISQVELVTISPGNYTTEGVGVAPPVGEFKILQTHISATRVVEATKITKMASDLVHAIGHFYGGTRNDESSANGFEWHNYGKKIKK